MYAAGVAGGVWKTTDAGASWAPLADLLPNIAVSCLAMDPHDPNTLYAGTGEGYYNIDALRGAGIFKTTDAGSTWSILDADNDLGFRYVNDIVVSPIDGQQSLRSHQHGSDAKFGRRNDVDLFSREQFSRLLRPRNSHRHHYRFSFRNLRKPYTPGDYLAQPRRRRLRQLVTGSH